MAGLRRSVLVLIAALAAIVALATPASAHATLVRSSPADASVLDEAPSQIELIFSEPVSVEGSAVEFIDAEGNQHDAEITGHGDNTSVLVVELGDPPDGLYSLRWSAFSTSDGHVTKGMLVWGFGTGVDLSEANFATPSEPLPPIEVLTRWALYVGLAAVLGGVVVGSGVLEGTRRRFTSPGDAPWHEMATARTNKLMVLGSRVAAGAATLLIVEQLWKASSASGQGMVSTIEASLLATAWGRWALTRAIALAVLALVLPRLSTQVRRGPLVVAATGIAITGQAAGGHSAGTETGLLSVLNDTVHLATSLAWAGALFILWRVLRSGDNYRSPVVKASLSAFSPLATVLFSAALITGVLSIGGQVRSLDALIESFYGRAMLLKLVLVAAVALVALASRRSITGDRPGSPIAAETMIAASVVGVVAMLTAVSPANGVEWLPKVDAEARQLAVVQDDIQLAVTVSPNVPGQNLFLVDAISTRRPVPAPIDRVLVRVTPLEFVAATIVLEARPTGSRGEYEVPTTAFAVAGRYRLELVVRRADMVDVIGDFEWSVASPASARDVVLSDASLEDSTSLLGVAGAVVLIVSLGWFTVNASVRGRRMREVEDYLLEPTEQTELET